MSNKRKLDLVARMRALLRADRYASTHGQPPLRTRVEHDKRLKLRDKAYDKE